MRIAVAFVTIPLLAMPTAAIGQNTGKACAIISDDARRLSCYDAVFRVSEEPTKPVGDWTVSEETSKVDDSKTVFLSVRSIDRIRGRFGNKKRAVLMLRCKENTTSAFINFGGHFMSSLNHGTVTYRVDKRPSRRKRMTNSNNHTALGLWSGGTAIPFIKELFGGKRLYVSATPMSESAVEAEFNIGGLETAIAPLRKACNWGSGSRRSRKSGAPRFEEMRSWTPEEIADSLERSRR